ncbi:MAG: hypothetical protein M5U33_08385 [Pseudorhodoplanes sp.]|nr:hypothetical protein [Pseudorhodoplanes sp.]
MMIVSGSRKIECPTTSMMLRTRWENALFTISMRMCSFEISVQGEHRRKMMLKMIH